MTRARDLQRRMLNNLDITDRATLRQILACNLVHRDIIVLDGAVIRFVSSAPVEVDGKIRFQVEHPNTNEMVGTWELDPGKVVIVAR